LINYVCIPEIKEQAKDGIKGDGEGERKEEGSMGGFY
jgi:hypothetical protein